MRLIRLPVFLHLKLSVTFATSFSPSASDSVPLPLPCQLTRSNRMRQSSLFLSTSSTTCSPAMETRRTRYLLQLENCESDHGFSTRLWETEARFHDCHSPRQQLVGRLTTYGAPNRCQINIAKSCLRNIVSSLLYHESGPKKAN